LYRALDTRLAENDGWLIGTHITIGPPPKKRPLIIADIANFGWVNSAALAGIDIEEFPHLSAWAKKLNERDAVKKGLNVPARVKVDSTDPKELERIAKENSAWIMKGVEADKKK
jgi:glutathione S-transferase